MVVAEHPQSLDISLHLLRKPTKTQANQKPTKTQTSTEGKWWTRLTCSWHEDLQAINLGEMLVRIVLFEQAIIDHLTVHDGGGKITWVAYVGCPFSE